MLSNIFFSKSCVLFIIRPIGFNFSILKLSLLFYENLEREKPEPVATQSERPPMTQLNLMSFVKIQ